MINYPYEECAEGNSMHGLEMEIVGRQVHLSREEFLQEVEKFGFNKRTWGDFWDRVRIHNKNVKDIKCVTGQKTKMISMYEYLMLKFVLGDPKEVSDCCKSSVENGRCNNCLRPCTSEYLF